MKRCSKCDAWLPLDEFHRKRESTDGLQYHCIGCTRERRQSVEAKAQRRAQNKDSIRKYYQDCKRKRMLELFYGKGQS